MTTEGVAGSAVERMMKLREGKAPGAVHTTGAGTLVRKNFHLGMSGPGKSGKTHLALDARTHEVRAPDTVDAKFNKTRGEVLIPSKPLSVAVANFDRPMDTVLDNLGEGATSYEEVFYLNDDGEQYHPLELRDADFDKLFLRLDEFIHNAVGSGFELAFVDGGTITWELVRHWRLPPPTSEDGRNLPREYGPSNQTQRTWSRRLYSADIHSVISLEAREQWSKASGPDLDAADKPILKLDGWGKTPHYNDMTVIMQVKDKRAGGGELKPTRTARITQSLNVEDEGREVNNPSFADLFKLSFPDRPLVLREDWDEFLARREEHGGKLSW